MKSYLKVILPIAVLTLAAAATWALVRARPEIETQIPARRAPLVRVVTVELQDLVLAVRTQGTVLPRTASTLVAEVAGKIVAVAPSFEVGAFFAQGEVLVELDRRDHELRRRRALAQVKQAEMRLAREEAEVGVARQEWEALGEGVAPPSLVAREPQLAEARALLDAARADLEMAELELERTRIVAPFAGRLRAQHVDLGQYLVPGTPVAEVHATDWAEVRLPVPEDELAFLEVPWAGRRAAHRERGPEVALWTRFTGRAQAWTGHVVRSAGEFERRTGMLPLIARIENPFDLGTGRDRPPLAVGLFVEAEIEGRRLEEVVVLPRSALRRGTDGGRVMVVDGGGKLRFREVEVLRFRGSEVVITGGLEAGELVCISPLDAPVDGMEVRIELTSMPRTDVLG